MAKFGKLVKLDDRHEEVTIGTLDGAPVTVKMKAPRLGALDRIRQEMAGTEPMAPQVGVRKDERGRAMKGPDGRTLMARNEEDPAYIEARAVWERAGSVALVMECLRDEQVEVDAKREAFPNACAYWTAVHDEMGKLGIDQGVWVLLNRSALRLSTTAPTKAEVEAAREALGAGGN